MRGRLVSLNQLMVTIGIVAAYLSDYAFSSSGDWRMMLGVSAIPDALLFIGIFPLSRSPEWTKQEAMPHASWARVFSPPLAKPLFLGIALAVFQQVAGINTVTHYAPTIYSGLFAESDTAFGIGQRLFVRSFLSTGEAASRY